MSEPELNLILSIANANYEYYYDILTQGDPRGYENKQTYNTLQGITDQYTNLLLERFRTK
jgi:hypothetical protein